MGTLVQPTPLNQTQLPHPRWKTASNPAPGHHKMDIRPVVRQGPSRLGLRLCPGFPSGLQGAHLSHLGLQNHPVFHRKSTVGILGRLKPVPHLRRNRTSPEACQGGAEAGAESRNLSPLHRRRHHLHRYLPRLCRYPQLTQCRSPEMEELISLTPCHLRPPLPLPRHP